MDPQEKNTGENKVPLKSLRTYRGDVEETLAKTNGSISTIAIAEQERKAKPESPVLAKVIPKDHTARNKFFALAGGILLLLGAITVFSVYYLKSKEAVTIEKKTKALIVYSEEHDIPASNLTRNDLVKKITSEARGFKLPVNSVLYLNTTLSDGSAYPLSNIIALLAPKMPGSLSRSFENSYMLGVYSYDTNTPFIILTTNDYADSFAGMLKWEKDIPSDIGELFGIHADSTASFEDETMKNKDLRVIKDEKRNTVLLYSFIDKNTLVITGNEKIFTAILGKYLLNKSIR